MAPREGPGGEGAHPHRGPGLAGEQLRPRQAGAGGRAVQPQGHGERRSPAPVRADDPARGRQQHGQHQQRGPAQRRHEGAQPAPEGAPGLAARQGGRADRPAGRRGRSGRSPGGVRRPLLGGTALRRPRGPLRGLAAADVGAGRRVHDRARAVRRLGPQLVQGRGLLRRAAERPAGAACRGAYGAPRQVRRAEGGGPGVGAPDRRHVRDGRRLALRRGRGLHFRVPGPRGPGAAPEAGAHRVPARAPGAHGQGRRRAAALEPVRGGRPAAHRSGGRPGRRRAGEGG